MTNPAHRLNIKTWAYQLQNVDIDEIAACEADLVVIDAFDSDGRRWTKDDLEKMQANGKLVVAYFSIGEAEDYRPYWQKKWTGVFGRFSRPSWLEAENPEWKGNYKVKYWEFGWREILRDEIAAICKSGFDGVYLDIIDGYEYWKAQGRKTAADEMIDLVRMLANRGRMFRGEKFAVIPQNGEGLLSYRSYRDVISAIGKEDVFYGLDGDETENRVDQRNDVLDVLEDYGTANHIQTLFVEYMREEPAHGTKSGMMTEIREWLPRAMRNYPVYLTYRALDTLTPQEDDDHGV